MVVWSRLLFLLIMTKFFGLHAQLVNSIDYRYLNNKNLNNHIIPIDALSVIGSLNDPQTPTFLAEVSFSLPAPNSILPTSSSVTGFNPRLQLKIEGGIEGSILCMMFSYGSFDRCRSLDLAEYAEEIVIAPSGYHQAVAWVQGKAQSNLAFTNFYIPPRDFRLVSVVGGEGTGHHLIADLCTREWSSQNLTFDSQSYPHGFPLRNQPDLFSSQPDQILLLWREPREAIQSVARRMYESNLELAATSFTENQHVIFSQLSMVSNLTALRVDFELMINKPREVVKDISEFLNLEFTQSMQHDVEAKIKPRFSKAKADFKFPPHLEALISIKIPFWQAELKRLAPKVAGAISSR